MRLKKAARGLKRVTSMGSFPHVGRRSGFENRRRQDVSMATKFKFLQLRFRVQGWLNLEPGNIVHLPSLVVARGNGILRHGGVSTTFIFALHNTFNDLA